MTNSDEPTPRTDGGPAFPVVEPNHPTPIILRGMTLRDYFAGQALAGIMAIAGLSIIKKKEGASDWEAIAESAYTLADAMLAERSQTPTANSDA